MDYFIKFDNVSYSYINEDSDEIDENESMSVASDCQYAVRHVNFSVKKGEFIAIIGRNGSGKSTVARLINALLEPTEGKVYIDSKDTTDENNTWVIRSLVGMVFQNPDNQIVGNTVEDDIAFGLENIGLPTEQMQPRIDEALSFVGLSDCASKQPHTLSGGQKQRVAIAGVLAMRPQVIVLDESTAMLDPVGRKEVIDVISRLNKEENITIILITHHMDEVTFADRVVLIDEGNVVAIGTPRELFSQGDLMRKSGLEVPQVTNLFDELIKNGVKLPSDVINVDEAVAALENVLKK